MSPQCCGIGAKSRKEALGRGLARPQSSHGLESIKPGTSYALFVGLDMTDLAAVGAPARRARDLLGRGFGGAVSPFLAAAAVCSAVALLQHLLLLLALVAAFFVLFEALALLLNAGGWVSESG